MNWSREEYLNWLMKQRTEDSQPVRTADDCVVFQCGNITGKVKIYPEDIVELSVTNEKDENLFYLHFHLNEREHAEQLSKEMLNSLHRQKSHHALRILLSCTSALTTSYFAESLNEASRVLKLDYIFEAVSFDHIYEKGFSFDVILLAPQISFQYAKVRDIFHQQLVLKIPASIFASYSTGEMLALIRSEYKKKEDEGIPEENLPLRSIYDNPYRILTIAVINHSDGNRFGYRIYDHGKKTLDNEVIKPNASMRDLFDLLDYVLSRHSNIDYIGVSVPGVINKGSVDEPRFGYHGNNISFEISRRYHMHSAVINDVDAMALGYHAMHENFDDMIFLFLPRGMQACGAGVIMDGKLRRGYRHYAGELAHLTDPVLFPEDIKESTLFQPDTALKIITTSALAYITTVAPQKIVYYAELVPNEDEVHKELSRYIREEYIPELIHVWRLKRYQLPGTMIRCLEIMKYDKENPGWWGY